MQFQEISLAQKNLFKQYLAGRQYRLNTYNFNNFFLWRDWDPYRWALVEDAICIKSDFYGWDAVLVPFSPDNQAILKATERLIEWYRDRNQPFLMTEVSAEMRDLYERHYPGRFLITPYRSGFNYIYRQQDLAELNGKKYAAKRNHISRFLRENPDWRFVPLTEQWINGCRERELEWMQQHEIDDDLRQEHRGVMYALEHFAELGCIGACLVVQDRVESFTIGEALNDDTFVIHVEKGNTDLHGTYQIINQLFAEQYCQGFTYINRAEDMGHPGQRKAKMSYHPAFLEPKYHLRLLESK